VGPRAGLDDMEKRKCFTLPGLKLRLLARPARSQSLYRVSYRDSSSVVVHFTNSRMLHGAGLTVVLCTHIGRHLFIISAKALAVLTSCCGFTYFSDNAMTC
jgi:hypothetical protein